MRQTADIEALLNQTATRRLRFENVVNELLDEGPLTKRDLVISPERTSAYNFERDVREVHEQSNDPHRPFWQIAIPRDGFYDTLPERLFQQAKKRTRDDDEWAEIRQQEEKQERESRHFFLPFDSAFNHQRVAIDRFEARTLTGDDDLLVTELLNLVAPEADTFLLTQSQRLILFLLVVRAHQLVGNWVQTAEYLSRFLGVPAQIRYGQQVAAAGTVSPVGDWQPNRLGDGRLGLDWVLPQPAITDDGGLIRVSLGPLTDGQLLSFLPDGTGQRQLRLLAGYLFPAGADWRVDIKASVTSDTFSLATDETTGRLGLTTILH